MKLELGVLACHLENSWEIVHW